MKRKVLKAMACAVSVCMMSMSLAGCGNDDAGNGSSSGSSSSEESSGGEDSGEVSAESSIGDDRSDGLYPAYDLGGVTLTLLRHNNFVHLDPDNEDLEDWERAEKQDMKDYIEAKYNVKLELVNMPTDNWDNMADED